MECPGCGSYSSRILTAYQEDEPCPVCGLSSEAMHEIETVRESRANEELKTQLETAIKERDQAQSELALAKSRLARIERDLGSLLYHAKLPLKPTEGWD
jgi:hypothetical protein